MVDDQGGVATREERRGEAGFTLFGLLGVLLLIGIVLTFAYQNLGRASGPYALRAEARRVYAELSETRERATTMNREQAVLIRGGRHLHRGVRTAVGWRPAGRAVSLPTHVSVRANGARSGDIVFHPLGRASRPYTIAVMGSGRQEVMRVEPSGMIAWER